MNSTNEIDMDALTKELQSVIESAVGDRFKVLLRWPMEMNYISYRLILEPIHSRGYTTPMEKRYLEACEAMPHLLKKEWLHQRVRLSGSTLTIEGYDSQARKYPIVLKRLIGGGYMHLSTTMLGKIIEKNGILGDNNV
jgi:hypothetical protein